MAKVLIVEDNELNRDMLSRRLTRRGYQVLCALDGLEGVRQAALERPDLILMDMDMPILDGWEATRRIKAAPETRAVPIVALTAHAMASDRNLAIAAGCDDYAAKPVEFEGLIAIMETLLRRRRAE